MTARLGLSVMKRTIQHAPLAALGHFLWQQDFVAPLREHVQFGCKAVLHEPHAKLLDVVVSRLADGASLNQLNTRLRPDLTLAAAGGRDIFADQSTMTRVLDAFTPASVAQLRTAVEQIYGHTVRRLDGGFGTDANLNWALWHGDHVLAKGYSGKRAHAFARAVARWEEWRAGECWVAPAPPRLRYDRRTQTAALKWKTEPGTYGHSLLTTSFLEHTLAALAEAYDDRAAIEAEMKVDKGGLQLHRRRKRRLAAQEALVLLTDLAYNLLAWSRSWMFRDSPCAEAGIYRLVQELFPRPGKVTVQGGHIVKLRLKASPPLARPMLACLPRLFDRFGTPRILRKS